MRFTHAVLLILVLSLALPMDALARYRGSRSSSSRSYSRSSSSRSYSRSSSSRSYSSSSPRTSYTRSSSASSKPKTYTRSSSSPSTTSTRYSRASGTSSRTAPRAKMSDADRKLRERAKSQGTYYKSKTAAQNAFKTKYEKQHLTTFATKPAVRPKYIPQSYSYNGSTVPIQIHMIGGRYHYGHYNNSVFVPYRTYNDPYMRRYYGYDYVNPHRYRSHYTTTTTHNRTRRSGGSGIAVFVMVFLFGLFLIFIFVVVGVVLYMASRKQKQVQPPRVPSTTGKTEKTTLENVKVGQFIQLSDAQAIEDSMENGSLEGIRYEVKRRRVIDEQSDLCKWTVLDLRANDEDVVLVHKKVGEDENITVYFEAPDLPHGDARLDWLDKGLDFLWEIPEEAPENCSELEYSRGINAPLENAEHEIEDVEFVQKAQPLFGGMKETGSEPVFTTVVEFLATADFVNPELLVLEIGEDEKEGGMVSMYVGSPVREDEISIY